ncbi:DUF4863 family protein [Bordetella sp. BOR01]|uniref:DUF4863 family protein n=1 Tax=Bordetella sp. BOR01 TaxID=2854779 RepID=UPI001C43E32B|nr:DUF4863 family protein [Bordetella sp. BOR01]MBV7484200.1 DUF4863 family protein [Bordetella sp. BOR01]
MSTPAPFHHLMRRITAPIAGLPLDESLQARLNREMGSDSDLYREVFAACRQGVAEGWMCSREGGGIRYGRVVKPDEGLDGFSVDVVDMDSLAGPHHAHPQGEIDLIMPLDEAARFDGHGAGWLVYGPGSAHRPTVTGGQALVLYLLPAGAIEFTRA